MVLQIFNHSSSDNPILASFSHLSLMHIVESVFSIYNTKSWKSVFLRYFYELSFCYTVVTLARLQYFSPLEGKDELKCEVGGKVSGQKKREHAFKNIIFNLVALVLKIYNK